MPSIKIGSPLFIVREQAEKDLLGVLEKIAAIGYDGVEFVGLYGNDPAVLRRHMDALGLRTISSHVSITDFLAKPEETLQDYKTLGSEYITLAVQRDCAVYGSPEYAALLESLQALCRLCYDNGITPLYHNHNHEFAASPDYVTAFMDDCAGAGLCLEPDLGWMAYAGADPVAYLRKYRDRTPVIHMKDIYVEDFSKIGPAADHGGRRNDPETGFFEFRPTGYGIMNFPRLLPLCLACKPKWIIADHDLAYERDSFEELDMSYRYVKGLLALAR